MRADESGIDLSIIENSVKEITSYTDRTDKEGVAASLFETMWKYNKKVRKVHDWEEVPFAVSGNKKKASSRKTNTPQLNKPIYS